MNKREGERETERDREKERVRKRESIASFTLTTRMTA